jgi:hypothetical protein
VAATLGHASPAITEAAYDGEHIKVTVVRALLDDCDHLLATLDDYRSHLVVERPRNPDQLDLPF